MIDVELARSEDRIVWVDVESDGLSPRDGCQLLQIATIVTDGNLDEVGEPYMAKVKFTEDQVRTMRDNAVEFVRDMHDASNLWNTLPTEGKDLAVIEEEVLAHLISCGVEERKARLGGNSITLDRNFMEAFTPRVLNFLHYRNYDMSSVGGFVDLARTDIPWFEKAKTHDALDDIRESLGEARHYRDLLRALRPSEVVDITSYSVR